MASHRIAVHSLVIDKKIRPMALCARCSEHDRIGRSVGQQPAGEQRASVKAVGGGTRGGVGEERRIKGEIAVRQDRGSDKRHDEAGGGEAATVERGHTQQSEARRERKQT